MKNALITDNLFYPLGMNKENTEVYTWYDFIKLGDDGFELDSDAILYVDVDNLDESISKQIIQWRPLLDIKFITYDEYKPSFLKNEVIDKVEASDIPIRNKNENVISLDENKLWISGNFLVYTTDRKLSLNCDNTNATNKFLIKVKQQLKTKNVEIVYMNNYTTKFENNFDNKIIAPTRELAEELVKIKQEVNDRLQLIGKYDDEQYKIRTIYDLPENIMPKTKFYILDNFIDILKYADTESMDIISSVIDAAFMFHMSITAGIYLILVVDDTDPLIELLFRPKEDKRAIFDIIFIDGSSFFMSRAFNMPEREAAEILAKKTDEDIVVNNGLHKHWKPVISKIDKV